MPHDNDENDQSATEVYRPRPAAGWYEDDGDDLSVVEVANVLLSHRWKVIGLPLALAFIVVVATVLWPVSYTSEASIVPQSGSGVGGRLSQLSGVASQFGVNIPGGEPGQSPQFYADLLTSRRLLEEAVLSEYRRTAPARPEPVGEKPVAAAESATARAGSGVASPSDSAGATLIQLYDIRAPSRAVAISRAARRLESAVSVSTDPETGVVHLAVTTPWPHVSRQVAEQLVELVNEFNNRVRQSQASAEAAFIRQRLDEARKDLRVAEDSLENFLQRNVGWQQSPPLRFQHDRLQRRVNLKQQLYTSLATRYEEARISEVKSTPVVTTVTRPQAPAQPDPRQLPVKAAFGLLVGGILGLLWAFGSEFTDRLREENTEDYREFMALKENAANEVKRTGRRIRRLLGSGPTGGD